MVEEGHAFNHVTIEAIKTDESIIKTLDIPLTSQITKTMAMVKLTLLFSGNHAKFSNYADFEHVTSIYLFIGAIVKVLKYLNSRFKFESNSNFVDYCMMQIDDALLINFF